MPIARPSSARSRSSLRRTIATHPSSPSHPTPRNTPFDYTSPTPLLPFPTAHPHHPHSRGTIHHPALSVLVDGFLPLGIPVHWAGIDFVRNYYATLANNLTFFFEHSDMPYSVFPSIRLFCCSADSQCRISFANNTQHSILYSNSTSSVFYWPLFFAVQQKRNHSPFRMAA